MRSGLKLPRGKSKMGMGMGMGMGMPIFIPVVIPMGGYGRHRNSYRYGEQLFLVTLIKYSFKKYIYLKACNAIPVKGWTMMLVFSILLVFPDV